MLICHDFKFSEGEGEGDVFLGLLDPFYKVGVEVEESLVSDVVIISVWLVLVVLV